MNGEYDPYMAAAKRVLESDDPVAELLELGRLETLRRRRLWRLRLGCVTALVLAGVGTLWLAYSDLPSTTTSVKHTAIEDSLWMQELASRARRVELSVADEDRLRTFLRSGSSLRRRGAVVTLSGYGKQIDPAVLDKIAFELAETIDIPVQIAASGRGHVSEALAMSNRTTLRAVATAIWYHCARTHEYPRVSTIERLLLSPDPEVRKSCCKALGQLTDYVLSPELRARIQGDTSEIRRAARRLLTKGK